MAKSQIWSMDNLNARVSIALWLSVGLLQTALERLTLSLLQILLIQKSLESHSGTFVRLPRWNLARYCSASPLTSVSMFLTCLG